MGCTGKGITIAVIDTGLNAKHEQFAGRVIAAHCYSQGYQCKLKDGCKPCDREDKECDIYECYDCKNYFSSCDGVSPEKPYESDSALPRPINDRTEFDHGSHVTGIAAGKDGMAPGANIVPVQAKSEFYDPAYITDTNPDGYGTTMSERDLYRAYNWLLDIQVDLKKDVKPISILNLSLGGGRFADYCDTNADYASQFSIMRKLNDAGILPVAAAGNED